MKRAWCRTVRMHGQDKKSNDGQMDSDLADMMGGLAKPYRMKMQLYLDLDPPRSSI